MPPPYSYTPWESFVQWITGGNVQLWKCPPIDKVQGRFVDQRKATTGRPFEWAPELRNARLTIGATTTPWDRSVTGIPVQRVAPNAPTQTVTVNNTYMGTVRRVQVPRPPGGFWVEGNPNQFGAWDAHVIVVCVETGEAWELIGFTEATSMALAAGHWRNGALVDGEPVCAANVQMSALLSAPGDPSHRRGLVLTNYVCADGDKKPGTGWPTCGDLLRLTEAAWRSKRLGANAEQLVLIDDLRDGAQIYDRGGVAGLGCVAGADWARSTLPRIPLVHGDFELAV